MNDQSGKRYIHELAEKLKFLAMESSARKIHGHSSQNKLAEACGIKEPTFKTLRSTGNADRISPEQERGLARACRFRLDWPQWVAGSAKEFQERYLREVKPGTAPSRKRRTGVPLTTAGRGEQRTKDGRFASIRMRALSNSGVEWRIWVDLFCRATDGYGIRRGFVTVDCGKALAERDEANFKEFTRVDGANAELRIAAGTDHEPIWEIRALTAVLDEDIRPGEHFCIVKELADGGAVKVSFSVYVKDVPAQQSYICKPDGKPLVGANRKLMLDRIAALDLLEGQGHAGKVILCSHEITFEATDNTPPDMDVANA